MITHHWMKPRKDVIRAAVSVIRQADIPTEQYESEAREFFQIANQQYIRWGSVGSYDLKQAAALRTRLEKRFIADILKSLKR